MSRSLIICEFSSNIAIITVSMMSQSSTEYIMNNVVNFRYVLVVQSSETIVALILSLISLSSEYIKKSFMMLRFTDVLCFFTIVFLLSAMFIVNDLHYNEVEYEVICFKFLTNIFVRLFSLMINNLSELKVLFLFFERVLMILR